MALSISIGADPELLVREKSSGRFVSAHDLMPGTKNEPHKVTAGAVQVDGVAAEFNILPAKTDARFVSNIAAVMSDLQGFLGEKYELVSEPAVVFPDEYFKSLPEHVRELGCNPDFDPYTGQVTPKPDSTGTMRTAAGHVHIGWRDDGDPTDDTHFSDCCIIAKNLDYYLGLFSLQWDSDTQRRKLYGRAGCFRPKPYGIEYRPLSNVWLRTPQLQQWVFNATRKCMMDLMVNGVRVNEELGDVAKDFINNSESWWNSQDTSKSKDHKKLQNSIYALTGLKNPPPIPKPLETKTVQKPEPKHVYDVKAASPKIVIDKKAEQASKQKIANHYLEQLVQ